MTRKDMKDSFEIGDDTLRKWEGLGLPRCAVGAESDRGRKVILYKFSDVEKFIDRFREYR